MRAFVEHRQDVPTLVVMLVVTNVLVVSPSVRPSVGRSGEVVR